MSTKFRKYFEKILETVDLLGTKPSDYTKKLKNQAKKVESEHSDSVKKQIKTGMEHAAEFPIETDDKIDSKYYDELDKMEKHLKRNKQTKSFKEIVKDLDSHKLKENMVAGGIGSMFGPNVTTTATQFSGDNYARGDARMPYSLLSTNKKTKKHSKKKSKKRSSKHIKIIRRTFPAS